MQHRVGALERVLVLFGKEVCSAARVQLREWSLNVAAPEFLNDGTQVTQARAKQFSNSE